MNKLKIYACSGVGEAQLVMNYWLNNTQTTTNTQAVNTLLARINLAAAEYNYLNQSDEDKAKLLDTIDFYAVCLVYAGMYKDNPDKLHHAGEVIGRLYELGAFVNSSIDNDERDANLDSIFDKVEAIMDEDVSVSGEFMSWWKTTIEQRNKVGMTEKQQQTWSHVADKAEIGYADYNENKDLSRYLNDAGTYFLYTYFTDEQLKKMSAVVRMKAATQKKVYKWCKGSFVGVYGSEDEMQAIIRTGIISDFKDTPENVCASLANKGTGIGLDPSVIVAIIEATVTIIIAVISAICTYCAEVKVAEFAAVDTQAAVESTPNPDDWGEVSESNINLPIIALIAVGAYLLLKK